MGNRYGFHSGVVHSKNIECEQDFNIGGNLVFKDVSAGQFIPYGRVSSGSIAGTATLLDANYTYGQLWEIRTAVTSWTGIAGSFSGYYFRAESRSGNASYGIRGMEVYGVFNVTTGTTGQQNLQALYAEALIKANTSGNKTITTYNAIEANISVENYGSTTLTFTNDVYAVRAKVQTGTGIADYTKMCGIAVEGRDDGTARTFGKAISIHEPEATVAAWTTGISISAVTTTGINITGNATDGLKIQTGTFTDAIEITGTTTNGLNISGTSVTTGISITGPGAAVSASKTLSSQTTENKYFDLVLTTDSTYITGTDITYSGARGSSNLKLTGTYTGASGGYSNLYSLVTASVDWTGAGDGVIGVKSVVLSSGSAVTDGNLYGGQFISKKAGAGTALAAVAIIGCEGWFYETDSSEVRTGIGGNFGFHADSTAASHAAGSVWRGVQIFCDNAGTSAAAETTGLCVWSQTGTLGNGIQLTPTNTITAGIRLVGGGTITTGLKFGGDAIAGASNVTMTTGINLTETASLVTGIELTNCGILPDASRTNSAIAFGHRGGTTHDLTMGTTGAKHFDPVQFNVAVIGSNPDATSTVNLIYQNLAHSTANMANLRLKGSDWTIDIQKNLQDAYVYQGEIDFSTNAVTVGGEAAGLGITMSATSAVTGNVWGAVFAMSGSGLGTSAGIFISARSSAVLTHGVYIEPSSGTTITNGIYMNNSGTITNLINFAQPTNSTNLLLASAEGGCIGSTRTTPNSTATCDGSLVVKIGSKTLLIPLYNAVTIS